MTKPTKTPRRASTRIYPVGGGNYLHITKEWAWAPKAYVWMVWVWPQELPCSPLAKVASFTEARNFVREYAAARCAGDAA